MRCTASLYMLKGMENLTPAIDFKAVTRRIGGEACHVRILNNRGRIS